MQGLGQLSGSLLRRYSSTRTQSQPSRHTNPWSLKGEEQEAEDCSYSRRASSYCLQSNTAQLRVHVYPTYLNSSNKQKPSCSWGASLLHNKGKVLRKYLWNHKKYWEFLLSFYTHFWRKTIVQKTDTSKEKIKTQNQNNYNDYSWHLVFAFQPHPQPVLFSYSTI